MEYSAEYTLKIKLSNIFLLNGLSDKEINDKIIEVGKREASKFLSGYLIDPEKKTIEEKITYKELK